MADLNSAMTALGHQDYGSLPSDLKSFMKDCFAKAEIILNSVPLPPPGDAPAPSSSSSTKASSAADTLTSYDGLAKIGAAGNEAAQKEWGKPQKLKAADNPLNVSVYKMSGHDKNGAWFARRSVHRGIGFTKLRETMEREFDVSAAVHDGPGSGAIRGIAGDEKLEEKEVDGVGKLQVWQLSSVFPGPVTPREFVAMLLTSTSCLSAASQPEGARSIPRHFVNISKPTSHPAAAPRQGLVMGHYESVEMIREVPTGDGDAGAETNPVEWIMITRSDPGGGIPRFMVERGTPGGIVGDVPKLLDWALAHDTSKPPEKQAPSPSPAQAQEKSVAAGAHNGTAGQAPAPSQPATADTSAASGGGILATIAGAAWAAEESVQNTVAAYLPTSLTGQSRPANAVRYDADAASNSSDSSDSSFASADSHLSRSAATASTQAGGSGPAAAAAHPAASPQPQRPHATSNTTASSSMRGVTSAADPDPDALAAAIADRPSNSNERELLKLQAKRAALSSKFAEAREEEAARTKELSARDDDGRALEKHESAARKASGKREKELDKLERKREKEARKVEERRRKAADKDELAKAKRERDEWRARCETVEKEVEALRRQVSGMAAGGAGVGAGGSA